MIRDGVLYIAFKKNPKAGRIREVTHSAKSVKRIHPNLHTTLFTNIDINKYVYSCFDNIIKISIDSERVKQKYLINSPYQNTLYLDSDTEVVGPINIFRLMDRFDIAAVQDHARVIKERNKIWDQYAAVPDGFPEYAGGVILFRKSPTIEKFFSIWRKNYNIWVQKSGKINDQPSFRVSMWECQDLKVHTLPQEFNIRTQEKRDKLKNIVHRIYHWHNMYDKSLKRTPQKF